MLLCVLPASFTYHDTVRVPYSLLTKVSALYYQPSRQKCCHLALMYKFAAANILLHRWKQRLRSDNWSGLDRYCTK
jgi:hypothetical protein